MKIIKAKFSNGIFTIQPGMKVRTIRDYEGEVTGMAEKYGEFIILPACPERDLKEEVIWQEFANILFVSLKEKEIGEFGILNEFKIPVYELYKL